MDLPFSHEVLSPHPVTVAEEHVQFTGAIAPIVLPLAWTTAHQRATWLVDRDDVPLALRVRSALDADMRQRAWALIRGLPDGLTMHPRVQIALQLWSARQLAALGLPGTGGQILLHGDGNARQRRLLSNEASNGIQDCRDMLEALPWPRWAGPLVLVRGEHELPGLEQTDLLIRPALPMARLPASDDLIAWRVSVADTCCRLYLGLADPPEAGWPRWFLAGMRGVARAKARGEGPSPRRMHERRRQAGADALRSLLLDERSDDELATAVCAVLCHSRKRFRLPSMMDALREDVDAFTALRIAYELDVPTLLREP